MPTSLSNFLTLVATAAPASKNTYTPVDLATGDNAYKINKTPPGGSAATYIARVIYDAQNDKVYVGDGSGVAAGDAQAFINSLT